MTKIIVFDSVNLKTALLARQIQDFNDDIWIFMNGQIEENKTPVMFKESEYIAWLLNFCDADVTVLRDDTNSNNSNFVYVPNITTGDLIDRLLNKTNISLTSDTPISINFKAKTVTVNDTVGYSFIPFGDITSIFIAQPIDKFYDFKFGKLIYRKPEHVFWNTSAANNNSHLEMVAVDYEQNLVTNTYINNINRYYDDAVVRHTVNFNLIANSTSIDETCFVDSFLSDDNLNLFNSYLTYNKLNKRLKYIGPSKFSWPSNPLLIDLNNLFDIISTI